MQPSDSQPLSCAVSWRLSFKEYPDPGVFVAVHYFPSPLCQEGHNQPTERAAPLSRG